MSHEIIIVAGSDVFACTEGNTAALEGLARSAPQMAWTTLAHHRDLAWMKEAYRRAAPGVNGQRAQDYAVNLEANL